MATDRAKALIEQSEGRKLCDEALREIELGRSTFLKELARFRDNKTTCEKDGPGCRHWTVAERLLKKAQRSAEKPLQALPVGDSSIRTRAGEKPPLDVEPEPDEVPPAPLLPDDAHVPAAG